MLFYLSTRIVSATAAFLYPGYASYKTLSQKPASTEDLERWLMYWSVLGCIVGVEYVAEWMISWVPFYYTLKTLFLLYLSSPQTRGSTFLYKTYLQPFFNEHESYIDASLASVKVRLYAFFQERFRMIWDAVLSSMNQNQNAASGVQGGLNQAPPTLADPVAGPTQLLGNLWRNYGPVLVASGAALLRQPAAAPQPTPANNFFSGFNARVTTPPPPPSRSDAASLAPSSPGSDTELRLRHHYEEVEVPSDIEGYDLASPITATGSNASDGAGRSAGPTRASWFGWGAGATGEKSKGD